MKQEDARKQMNTKKRQYPKTKDEYLSGETVPTLQSY